MKGGKILERVGGVRAGEGTAEQGRVKVREGERASVGAHDINCVVEGNPCEVCKLGMLIQETCDTPPSPDRIFEHTYRALPFTKIIGLLLFVIPFPSRLINPSSLHTSVSPTFLNLKITFLSAMYYMLCMAVYTNWSYS